MIRKITISLVALTHTVMEGDRQTDGRTERRTDRRCIKVRLQCVARQQRHAESRLRQREDYYCIEIALAFPIFSAVAK